MKMTKHSPQDRQIGMLLAVLLMLGQFITAKAQTSQTKINISGEDSKFEHEMIQPETFLARLGFTPVNVQDHLRKRPSILVGNAGSVRTANLGQVTTESTKLLKSLGIPLQIAKDRLQPRKRILVSGAGSVQGVALKSLTDARQLQFSIHLDGASSSRISQLVPFAQISDLQPPMAKVQIMGASFVRTIDLIGPSEQ